MSTEKQDNRGPSIYQQYLNGMDSQLTTLMSMMGLDADDPDRNKQQGLCAGIAWCIALMENPYEPRPDVVRRKAMERHYKAQGGKS